MKKLLIIIFIIISFDSFAQNPGNYTSINGFYRWRGGMHDSGLHVPRYNGTPVGRRVGVSPNSGAVAIDTIGHTSFFYSGDKWRNQGSFSFETRLIQGGIVTWDSLLIFSVSPATYYINGAFYTSSVTRLTLDAAHATLDRIDLIYLDSTGAHKETGTAAATPAEPNLPPNSIRLTAIQVPATSTVPGGGVDTLVIYDENVEWVGSSTSVTVDFANKVSPFHFINATSTGSITNLSTVKYTASTPIDITDYDVLRFRIKLKAVFNNNTYLRVFFTSTASNVHVPVELRDGLFGFSRFSLNYQEISIPIAALSFINTSVDGLYFQSSGNNSSGFYLDWIQLFANIDQAPPQQENHKFGEGDVTAIGNRAFNARNNNFSINNVNEFTIGRTGITRIYQNSSASGLYSPNGINHNYVTNAFAGFNVSSGANYFLTLQDSSKTAKKISYEGNLHGLFNARTLVDKSYVDSVVAAGGSTPNLQQVTDVGSTTTNNIIVDNANFDAIGGSSFRVKDDDGDVVAVLWYNDLDYGELRLKAGTGTIFIFGQQNTSNNDLYTPKTGNANDTIATLHDVRAGGFIQSGAVTLTESSATTFYSTTVGSGAISGGEVVITIEANDATDFQARTLRFIWSAVNKAGTTTITVGTPEEAVAVSSGTLTATITGVDAGSGVIDFKANAVSSLTQTTLRCRSRFIRNF